MKTSVSLSNEVLSKVSQLVGAGERSDFIERALWNYIDFLQSRKRNRLDLEKINDSADFLNREAEDSLSYQEPL